MPQRNRIAPEAKAKAVIRLLAGESRESLSQEYGVSVSRLSRWEQIYTEGGEAALKKDHENRGRGFLYRHRKAIGQWVFLIVALLTATLFLTRFMLEGAQ